MAIDHIIPELDRKGLRSFGLTTGAVFVVVFGVFFPWILEKNWPLWPWVVAAPLWVLALIHPPALRLIYIGWMHFGLLASRVMTPLILGIVFFLVISPMALVRRRLGRDPLQRALDPNNESYRVQSTTSPREKLEKPF
jgi:hypothetical protein